MLSLLSNFKGRNRQQHSLMGSIAVPEGDASLVAPCPYHHVLWHGPWFALTYGCCHGVE